VINLLTIKCLYRYLPCKSLVMFVPCVKARVKNITFGYKALQTNRIVVFIRKTGGIKGSKRLFFSLLDWLVITTLF